VAVIVCRERRRQRTGTGETDDTWRDLLSIITSGGRWSREVFDTGPGRGMGGGSLPVQGLRSLFSVWLWLVINEVRKRYSLAIPTLPLRRGGALKWSHDGNEALLSCPGLLDPIRAALVRTFRARSEARLRDLALFTVYLASRAGRRVGRMP
jgi:hypothetical protein